MTAQTDLYDSLYNSIVGLTARPDLEEETALALRTATRSAHSSGAFPRDAAVQAVQLPNQSYATALDIQVLLPRLRGITTVQLLGVDGIPANGYPIDIVELNDIYTPQYNYMRNNIAYISGNALNIRTSMPAYGYLIQYYQMPFVNRDQYNSWIAQLAPDAIVFHAAAIVGATNGNEEKAAAWNKLVDTLLRPALIRDFVTSEMR